MRVHLDRLLMRWAVIAVFVGAAAGCGTREVYDSLYESVSCGPHLDRYPVKGPHHGGYDANWGNFTCPPHPRYSRDVSDFVGVTHLGNDIFGEQGTQIVAGRAGLVVHAGWDDMGGWRVTITDGCNWSYYYAHLEIPPEVVEGQEVEAGTFLGRMGRTGSAWHTAPHLHFSIYPGEDYQAGVDPFPFLQEVDATSCLPDPAAP